MELSSEFSKVISHPVRFKPKKPSQLSAGSALDTGKMRLFFKTYEIFCSPKSPQYAVSPLATVTASPQIEQPDVA